MKAFGTKLLLAASLLAIGACAKKPPKELPPPPVDNSAQQAPPPMNPGAAPGSQADFVASVAADRVFFATDSSEVDQPGQSTLQSQAAWFARYPNVRVTVEGHADERGTREYNLALGDRRANAAKNALVALGVSAGRITTISYGKERPDAIGSDEAAYAKNRRAVSVTVQ
ncbi:peptidoglycan-associated lipoprotein Pal [Sphingomonas paeninsulae]|jgi:peptidoglycan-associated lipoprotein|uniref:Peptidoglycan-associated lipoprotein n=1 Tax=Sphingomonas paeninsulae TaxID=2319844 RepID=A0A494TLS6_SPHPE|nr:peptidoglycan-associated lipoprotein Pal [Sphingomonas paeninsulae]AYJ86776.1 peptidoglycan-associated lipoprotein Pal [Sphingomonas paeninsulae]